MARTVDVAAHAVRRDAFVDAAERLIQTKGYEQMSVQDVLDELDASRGAFYHYFSAKADLLEAVVGRMVEHIAAAQSALVEDASLPAKRKLEAFFAGIARWKTERTDLMLALLRVWSSDDNAIVREKLWQGVALRLTPPLSAIIRQGRDEGVFTTAAPEEAAHVLIALMQGLNAAAVRLFFDSQEGRTTRAAVERFVAAYTEAIERILGLPARSLTLVDPAILRQWFA